MTDATGAAELRPLQIEMNGINVISESERDLHIPAGARPGAGTRETHAPSAHRSTKSQSTTSIWLNRKPSIMASLS